MAHKRLFQFLIWILVSIKLSAQLTIKQSDKELNIGIGNEKVLLHCSGLANGTSSVEIRYKISNEVALFQLSHKGPVSAESFAGIFFDNIPEMKQAVAIWRYKPWNSWTKPMKVDHAADMPSWDVQFFYWQYQDGLYGAAVPLSGNGFRTTIGSESGRWGSKAVSYANMNDVEHIPGIAISFGKDPYEVFARIYREALTSMGKSANSAIKKTLPEPLQYIGWCTWNASNLGRDLNEENILKAVSTFTINHFPLGWVLVDDGWFQHEGARLRSLRPDSMKFPEGFKPLVEKLKYGFGIKYVGVWHAFNGYWNGIDTASGLGHELANSLFTWKQRENVDDPASPVRTYAFVKPEKDRLFKFYDSLHRYLKGEGFDFIKVDNQLVAERMALHNYPLFTLSEEMHKALYRSALKNFNNVLINCMDMTADAYLNFGSSAVARAVEDYFPYSPGESYDLQHGNAAAHIIQAVYNALYFSQMVIPDFDMFQSHNPHAVLHALARTLSNGPIYLTDQPGQQQFDILNKLVYADGRSIRSQTPLLPARVSLFQVQDDKPFLAFSKVRKTGLLAVMNLADADAVSGKYGPADVEGLEANEILDYEYFSGKWKLSTMNDRTTVQLPRMGYELHYMIPVKNGFAAIGLAGKYNAPATILYEHRDQLTASLQLYEGGMFLAYCRTKPDAVLVNGRSILFNWEGQLLSAVVPKGLKTTLVKVRW